jgi:16S rRNA (uracil1498-N3)-methyltransferase
MPARIYQPGMLAIGKLQLDEDASHHLARVLRAAIGDEIILFNGVGGEYHAVIRLISKKGVDVEILKFSERTAESPVDIYLAQGIARGEKMDFVIQKAVEMGVTQIYPVMTERCNVRLDPEREQKRLQHWQAVVVSACEQSGRNYVPIVHAPMKLNLWLESVNADIKFVLSPHVENKLQEKMAQPASIAILIGPEGGLSDQEVSAASQHGFTALQLGPRVLRTETAALAALAVLQFQFGDFS